MYNESIKKRYIEEKEKTTVLPKGYLTTQFEKVSFTEEELGKDLCDFTTYEIIALYKVLNLHSIESLHNLNSQLSMYTQFCIRENLVADNQNHFSEISMEILGSCVNKAILDMRIVSRKTVLEWIKDLPNPKDQFVLLALFELGKSANYKEITNMKITDINGNTVKLEDGRVVSISKELATIAQESYDAKVYYATTGKGLKTMPLVCYDDRVILEYPNVSSSVDEYQRGRRLYNSIMRSLDFLGIVRMCSANALSDSGKIHMIHERAASLGMTPMEYVNSENIKEVEYQYGCVIYKSLFCQKYKEYL